MHNKTHTKLVQIPLTNTILMENSLNFLAITKFFGKKLPAAGGFYLRSLPMKITKNTIKNYEKNNILLHFSFIHGS